MKRIGVDSGRRRTQRGAAAVEFALVMPILFLLVFGLIQYGLYFWSYQGGSDAARMAARQAAVSEPLTCDAFRADVRNDIASLGDESGATITRVYAEDPAGDPIQVGDFVTVTVSFTTFDLHLPFLPFLNDGRVTTTARSRVEYVTDAKQPEDCT